MSHVPMIELRDFQYKAATFLVERDRAILADEVGVGKTFPAIDVIAATLNSLPYDMQYALIVLPPHLVLQWQREIKRFSKGREDEPAFQLPVHVVGRHSVHTRELGPGWHITTYPTIQNSGRKSNPSLWMVRWPIVVADEAHRLRTRKSQQFKNFKALSYTKAYFLTGTPMENNPSDIWSLLHLCDNKLFSSYWRFVDDWFTTYKDPWKTHITGLRQPLIPLWEKMLDNYMLRRLAHDVLDLKDPVHIDIPVKATAAVKRAHDLALKDWRIAHPNLDDDILATSGGAIITKLRQFVSRPPEATNPKYDALTALIENDIAEDDSMIVYTWYRESAEYLYQKLSGEGYTCFMVHGDMHANDRAAIAEEWAQYPGTILIGTIGSMSEGLNLQNANIVVFYEAYYLPGQMKQAVGRVQRSGQEKLVIVYHLYVQQSVDQAVVRVWRKRERMLGSALKGEQGVTAHVGMAMRDIFLMMFEEDYDDDV